MANKRQQKKQEKKRQQYEMQQETKSQLDALQNKVDKNNAIQSEYEDLFNSDMYDNYDLHNKVRKDRENINARKYQEEQMDKVKKATIHQEKRKAAENVAKIDAMHGEALNENRIRDVVSDAVSNNSNMQEAQSYLNRAAKQKKISVDEMHDAKSYLRQNKQEFFPTKASDIKLKRADKSYRIKDVNMDGMDLRVHNPLTGEKANVNKKYFGHEANEVIDDLARGSEELGKTHLKKALSGRNLNALVNLGLSIVDYKDARDAGDGVLKAGVKAGAQFAAGEMLGFWMMPVALAKSVPTLAIKGFETTQSITRNMNSATRLQTFGEAQFQDTQQLATMRQAGMELAKMSQYNLQQSMMGNEAQYMHKL